ncbi:type VI secretion IcmF C-terminal domain-containing protein, partial [Vibrio sp. V36_P2S2PM302]
TLLSDASDNPLSNLYTLINKYTSVELSVPAPKDGKDNAQPDLNIDADKKESARQITLSFQAYHDLLTTNEQNQKPLDMVMADLASAQTWLKQFYQSKEPQKLAFQTLAASLKADNPITTLASASPSSDTLLQSLLSRITKQSNDMVMSLAHDYLNTTWREQVFQPYQQTLAAFYPFDTQSDSDASIADVKAFFMTNGTLDTYHNAMLKTFTASTPDSSPYLPGLLPDSRLALDPQVWQMLSKAKDIRQALFINDPTKVSVQFQVKAVAMSSDLTEFSISSEKPLFTYRHGPALWTQYNWLGDAQTEDKLDVALKAQSAYVAKANYAGNWNWFRLIEPRVTNTSAQNIQIEFDYGDSSVKLAIKTQGQNNPFVPGFFSAFSLPGSL